MEKSTGKRPAALDGPELPGALSHLWAWFAELSACRSYHMNGPNPISHQEIAAWALLTGAAPTPWEVTALRKLDACWLEASLKRRE